MADDVKGTPRANDGETDDDRRHGFFTFDQMLEIQKATQEVALDQLRKTVTIASNVLITLVALLASAFGLVTALAWNKAISDWLPTTEIFGTSDPLIKEFGYAALITIFAVVVIGFLGIFTSRLRGQNLMERNLMER